MSARKRTSRKKKTASKRGSSKAPDASDEDVLSPPPDRADAGDGSMEPEGGTEELRLGGQQLDELIDAVARHGLSPKLEKRITDELPIHLVRADRVPLEIYVKVLHGERVARALTRDISVSGLFLSAMTLKSVRAGTLVDLEFSLQGSEELIRTRALAVRNAKVIGFDTTALHFVELPLYAHEVIEQYVGARARLVEDDE